MPGHTALVPDAFSELIHLSARGIGGWTATIPDGWDFMGIPNGGLVSSVMAAALVEATERPDPVTSTAHFLRPAVPGPVSIDTEVLRRGRSLATARARLSQDDRLIAHLTASLGDLSQTMGETLIDLDLPPLPPPDECIPSAPTPSFVPPPIAQRMNLRLHPEQVGFAVGQPTGEATISGWADLPFGFSTAVLPLGADALPPSLFNTGAYIGPLPTIELTVHAHARPAQGPLATRFRTDHAGPRYVEEDGWISDREHRLIAVSRQIAVFPGR